MSYEAKIILDSISGDFRITTLQVTAPRFILAEINTHRMFSRNSASSRAIPVARRIVQISEDPFIPEAFGKNKAGMQATEFLEEDAHAVALATWLEAVGHAVKSAVHLESINVHKQWANRVIETYAWHTMVITATEWSNHDALRCHPDASPEYQMIARMMQHARQDSTPLETSEMLGGLPYWHLPYVMDRDGRIEADDLHAAMSFNTNMIPILRKVSVGRCAAISYERQEVKNFKKDVARSGSLRTSGHMSPFEHVARPMTTAEMAHVFRQKEVVWDDEHEEWRWVGVGLGGGRDPHSSDGNWLHFCGNVQGWVQDRKMIPNEHDFSRLTT